MDQNMAFMLIWNLVLGEDAEQQQQNRMLSAVVTSPLTTGVKLRIKDGGGVSGGGAGGRKIINRLSCTSNVS